MDQQPSSPQDLRERAVSSEPCSTRPNPFDDSDFSARKRRRTSLSGASRSRSVDSATSSGPSPQVEAQQVLTMKESDLGPKGPRTPEPQAEHSDDQPSDTVPSKVTLSLRNSDRPSQTSSPLHPTSVPPDPRPVEQEDILASVEDREVDMLRPPSDSETPAVTPETETSPVVAVDDDIEQEVQYSSVQPRATMVQNTALIDPAREFPYESVAETYAEVMNKLGQHYLSHEDVPTRVLAWLDEYLAFAKMVDPATALASFQQHRPLFAALPEIVLCNSNRKLSTMRDVGACTRLADLYKGFARLAAHLADLDYMVLQEVLSSENSRLPDLGSPFYLTILGHVTRRDDESFSVRPCDELSDVLEQFIQCREGPGGELAQLNKLLETMVQLIPRFPRILEPCGQVAQLVQSLIHECDRRLRFTGSATAGNVASVTSVALQGHKFFEVLSVALDRVIDKHLTALSFETAAGLINTLGEIYMILLAIHIAHIPLFSQDQVNEDAGGLPSASVPEVLASEWRMNLYGRLIVSSQMQLRVMAVSQMTQDLIHCWKKFSEPRSDDNQTILQHLAAALISTGLVPYILGPTCHPEITLESNNIIGFLVVTRTYTQAHTDLMWQTVTSTQDPRISDALLRMMGRSANLFHYEDLLYFCTKFQALPIEVFGPSLREFCDAVFKWIAQKAPLEAAIETAPSHLCLRLLRESSVPSSTAPVAYPEIQQFATVKFRELLASAPDRDSRQDLYMNCLQDIADKSDTTLGSLHALFLMIRQTPARELQWLTSEHNLTGLLVDELEYSISAGRRRGFAPVIHGSVNNPRRDLLYHLILHQPSTLMGQTGERLWHMLVGLGADYDEDRDAAWVFLNAILKSSSRLDNPFLATCFKEYLPKLPPSCFREGMLQFIKTVVLPLANTTDSDLLDVEGDDDESLGKRGMEQLWRVVLTAPNRTIELKAIQTLVNDIYIESAAVTGSSHHRTRKIHLALVGRCLRQLSSAAARLQSSGSMGSSGAEAAIDDVPPMDEVEQQSLLFIRSLTVLREFHRLYRMKSNFAAPDLRSIPLQGPGEVEGESAELKFQSFDGNHQTDIQTLNIGKRNTAASLLASLKEATGFEHYQLFYRGQAFIPQERDICKSLEDLQIHNGLILVKREPDAISTTVRIRPGASPVEIEILGHFEELWGYLNMDDKYAQEVYQFLTTLPVYEQMAHVFQSSNVSHEQVFPLGYPFKSLYAIYALREFVASRRRMAGSLQVRADPDAAKAAAKAYTEALNTALSLAVAVICDYEVVRQCANQDLQIILSHALIESLVHLVKDSSQTGSLTNTLDEALLTRLLSIEMSAVDGPPTDNSMRLIQLTFQAICECCSASQAFWDAFKTHDDVGRVILTLVLHDPRPMIRKAVTKILAERISYMHSSSIVTPLSFCEFLWPLISGFLPIAIGTPDKCEDIFALSFTMLKLLREAGSAVLDQQQLLDEASYLLLRYETYEDITQPEAVDIVACGLVRIIHTLICNRDEASAVRLSLSDDLARALFWKHLFPPWQQTETSALPCVILNSHTRKMLIEVIFSLVGSDLSQLKLLIEDLDALVPFSVGEDEEDPYHYELPQQFDRSDAIRSACGYVGLKNLSNTCYLNSLFTQLFMNTSFRNFMLNAEIHDEDISQNLLFATRNLFGSMQNSIKRWVDPQACVTQIKTYEDTHIDIHNQMDVDEFYNLLFDRWESQFRSPDEKKTFRSFYGGQLVQQVRSQECRHISERLEPFSAIQCDIKGKNSLEESLQAYVDGEIMEGDNKYKCSTCDRHVDAVKRACLKDIPDNLIFHLKRFDFNLRTLQRHKINEYFSFPSKIDMRPYTINHLSSPSDDNPPDIFELVGVLVHSGTAESGHYYSYIRERPSTKANETWVEFNDDVVSPWDTAHMEASCFGGTDYRNPLDGNIGLEKPYSAYMLFYQRSSSIKDEQEALLASGELSPLRVATPQDLSEHIQGENYSMLRRHCIFDPAQIRFVSSCLVRLRLINGGTCSEDHAAEHLAVRMALSYLDQVASRTKDIPEFQSLLSRVQAMMQACAKCSLAIYDYFDQRYEALRALVQRHPEPRVRQESGNLLLRALVEIKHNLPNRYGIAAEGVAPSNTDPLNPRNVIHGANRMMGYLWSFFHMHLRSWHETFGLMLGFTGLGWHEAAVFLDQGYLRNAVMIISADSSLNLDPQYNRMLNALQRRLSTKPPAYDTIIALIHRLLSVVHVEYSRGNELAPPQFRTRFDEVLEKRGGPLAMSRPEYAVLSVDWGRGYGNIFVEKLLTVDQNEASTNAILVRLLQIHHQMGAKILDTFRQNIMGDATPPPNGPFLRAALVFCRHYPNADKVKWLVGYIAQQTKVLENTEGRSFFRFHRDLASTTAASVEGAVAGIELELLILEYIPVWAPTLLAYYDPSVRVEVEDMLQRTIFRHGASPSFEELEGGTVKAEALIKCARLLGVECLRYLEKFFVAREIRIAEESVSSLQRVTHICSEYFDSDQEDTEAAAFDMLFQSMYQNPEAFAARAGGRSAAHMRTDTLDSLARLIMDNDVEEESDQQWNDSEGSELESLGSMNVDDLATYPKEFPEPQ